MPNVCQVWLPCRMLAPVNRTEALSLQARRAFGGLLPVLDDPELRDLLVQVDGDSARLWLDRGGGLAMVPGWGATPQVVARLAVALIAAGGRHLDELHPCADVQLGHGIRVHAVLPPIAARGAAVSVRVPRTRTLGFSELVDAGLCSRAVADGLWAALAQRHNFLITGATGSGKTTVLAALLDLVPEHERIITIEDVAELRLNHRNVVALQSRQPNGEGVGEVTLEQLLREALRMRPDRIVLGECRGAEVVTLLTALNTGHDGGAGTLHASTLHDVPARLEALGGLAGLNAEATARQVTAALHLVIQLERRPDGHRIAAIGAPCVDASGRLVMQEIAA